MNQRAELEQLRADTLARYEQLGRIVEKVVALVDEALADEEPAPVPAKRRHPHLTVVKGILGGVAASTTIRLLTTRRGAAATALTAAVAMPLAASPMIVTATAPRFPDAQVSRAPAPAPTRARPSAPALVPSAAPVPASQPPAVPSPQPSPLASASAPGPAPTGRLQPVRGMAAPLRTIMPQLLPLASPSAPGCTIGLLGICITP